jgi:hypothetical protein
MLPEKDLLRFWSKVKKTDDCWVWTGKPDKDGYGVFYIPNRKPRSKKSHRMSWELVNGPPGDMHVLHHCDNPPCIRPDHLWLGTDADNAADRARKKRGAPQDGSNNHATNLVEDDIRTIRNRYASGELQKTIAADYGLTQTGISQIVLRKVWKHVA